MITKRTGNGQTECTRCKEKGKFALNWDSFLYTFNDKPYCFDCLMEMLEEKNNAIDKAIEYINNNGILDLNGYDLLDILRGEDNE